MGGRGSAGGASSGVFGREKALKVETTYTEGRGWRKGYYHDTVLQATDTGGGNVELSYAKADSYEKTAKTNATNYVTYTLSAGFVNDTPHNINFDNVKSFSGQTYGVKDELKSRGYKWKNGKWSKE